MRLQSFVPLAFGLAFLTSCTALFLPDEQRVPTSLELSPRDLLLQSGDSALLQVILLDQFGEPFRELPKDFPLHWSISNPALAVLKGNLVKAERQGEGWIALRGGQLTAVANLKVTGVPTFFRTQGELRRSGVVGRPLAEPITVRVADRLGDGVADVPVKFSVTGGGGVITANLVKTDANGYASTIWTLGPKMGENVLEATADTLKGSLIRFTAGAQAGDVVRLEKLGGDQQQAIVGNTVPQDLVVQAFDKNGNAIPHAPVSWSVDGGSVSTLSFVTDERGVARARWKLGTTARALTAVARSGTMEARFGAVAQPGAPTFFRAAGGQGQTAAEGYPLPDSLGVRVTDAYDNPVPNVPVTWQVTLGGGSLRLPKTTTTQASGIARAQWVMGVSLPNAVQASAIGRTVAFEAYPKPLVPRDTLRGTEGLRYLEVQLAKDTASVRVGQTVSVFFSAYLLNGTLLERVQNKVDPPLRFVVGSGQVIRGFDLGVTGMRKGSIRRVFIPPNLGYGDRVVEHIPPNSMLVFDIEVVEIAK